MSFHQSYIKFVRLKKIICMLQPSQHIQIWELFQYVPEIRFSKKNWIDNFLKIQFKCFTWLVFTTLLTINNGSIIKTKQKMCYIIYIMHLTNLQCDKRRYIVRNGYCWFTLVTVVRGCVCGDLVYIWYETYIYIYIYIYSNNWHWHFSSCI